MGEKMSRTNQSHIFWGADSPLACLSGGSLLVMASCRLSYALVISGALLWVYGLSVLMDFPCRPVFPRRGKSLVILFLSAFAGSVYLLLITFANPVLGMELFFMLSLVPLVCIGSGIMERTAKLKLGSAVSRAFSEAAVLSLFIVAFSLIREPLGYFSLSLPGSPHGIIQIFSSGKESIGKEGFLPIFIISGSSGALLILGYGVSLYRYLNSTYNSGRG
jgi:hypothetical protein